MSAIAWPCIGGPYNGMIIARPNHELSFQVTEILRYGPHMAPQFREWTYRLRERIADGYDWIAQ
ncbi:MAG: hypothetical protein IPO08_23240 [Xanthomonadales bacterium]|nr:hypothetical protein [Xanthomonadales bacterium]